MCTFVARFIPLSSYPTHLLHKTAPPPSITNCQLAHIPKPSTKEEQDVDQRHDSETDESKRRESPSCAHVFEHRHTSMRQASRNPKTGYQESSNCTSCHVRIRVSDVIQHGKPEQRIRKAEQPACNNGRPVAGLAVRRKGEPE